jgi:membrane-associated phospholipid phosphatase
MNVVDSTLAAFSCVPCDAASVLNRIVMFVADAELLKGGVLMAVLWGLWLAGGDRRRATEIRSRVLMTVAGGFAALCVARLLAVLLPYRSRPFEAFASDAPVAVRALESWSAFPSDHAALFFAIATGILMISRPLGLLALAHAVVVITLPRLYLGLHYPTDLLAGAAIGSACAVAAGWAPVRTRCTARVLGWSAAHAPWLTALAFVMTFEIATLFDSVRNGARLAWSIAKPIVKAAPLRVAEGVALLVVVALVVALVMLARSRRVAGIMARGGRDGGDLRLAGDR